MNFTVNALIDLGPCTTVLLYQIVGLREYVMYSGRRTTDVFLYGREKPMRVHLAIEEVRKKIDAKIFEMNSKRIEIEIGKVEPAEEPADEPDEEPEIVQSPEQEAEDKKQCGGCRGLGRVRNQHREMVNCHFCNGRGEVAV